MPLVVHAPARSPCASIASMPIVSWLAHRRRRVGAVSVAPHFAVNRRLVVRGLQPFPPGLFRFGRQQLLPLKALLKRELQRAVADQQHVRRLLHHAPRDRDRVRDMLDRGHGAAVAVLIHDAGVERDVTVAIRIAGAADAVIPQIGLRHASRRSRPHRARDRSWRGRPRRPGSPPRRSPRSRRRVESRSMSAQWRSRAQCESPRAATSPESNLAETVGDPTCVILANTERRKRIAQTR